MVRTPDGQKQAVGRIIKPAADTAAGGGDTLLGRPVSQVVLGLVAWLGLFALGTLVVGNPFWIERSAGANPDYARAMYFHALLIGLAGLASLVACQVFEVRSRAVRLFILGASVSATVLAGIGGLFDETPKVQAFSQWFWLMVHVVGFFCLDAIFVALIVGLAQELARGVREGGVLPYWSAIIAAISLELAALMGHAAGWMIDFGDHPALIGAWAKAMGEEFGDLESNLVTSHSHEIVAGLLALIIATVAWRFGYLGLRGGARTLARVGLYLVVAGTVAMTVIYVVGGITANQPPTLFVSGAGGANGIAGDDVVTGVGVMLGGLLLAIALLLRRRSDDDLAPASRTVLGTIAWAWALMVATVVGAGYYIEMHETVFGAGSAKAAGAAADAVFTFAHQDFAFFLLPALMIVATLADLLIRGRAAAIVARWLSVGEGVAFVGVMIYVFATPQLLLGPGYVVTALGMAVIVVSLFLFLRGLRGVTLPQAEARQP